MNLDDHELFTPATAPNIAAPQRRPRRNPNPDAAIAKRNKRNRQRGNRTSASLAKYLGGRNVEALKEPWDVEGDGWRIQSKRLARAIGPAETLRLITAIPDGPWLRGLYHVGPRQRLASGTVFVLYIEWREWHGDLDWTGPDGDAQALLAIPLPLFRDIHCKEGGKA